MKNFKNFLRVFFVVFMFLAFCEIGLFANPRTSGRSVDNSRTSSRNVKSVDKQDAKSAEKGEKLLTVEEIKAILKKEMEEAEKAESSSQRGVRSAAGARGARSAQSTARDARSSGRGVRSVGGTAEPTNLALNKTVVTSGDIGYPGSNAVDGKDATIWFTMDGNRTLTVDLGKECVISKYVIKFQTSRAMPAFEINSSLNNTNWTKVDEVNNNTSILIDKKVTEFTARYVQLKITQGFRFPGFGTVGIVAEFEVWGVEKAGAAPTTTTTTTTQLTQKIMPPASTVKEYAGADGRTAIVTIQHPDKLAPYIVDCNGVRATTDENGKFVTPKFAPG
ncbi:MAG TPA: discoidin domain-containing protein, partial [bacterium]|nr:discoidin domain-containing protein [bacterium]